MQENETKYLTYRYCNAAKSWNESGIWPVKLLKLGSLSWLSNTKLIYLLAKHRNLILMKGNMTILEKLDLKSPISFY